MLIFSKCFCEYICHIFVSVYVGVVDYVSSMQISTVVIANVDVLSSNFDDTHGEMSESTLIIAVDWQQWWVFVVNVILYLKNPFPFSRGLWACDELGLESWHGNDTLLSRLPRDSSICAEQHMASTRFAVCAVIGPIGIRVPSETTANVIVVEV